ncbi:MAG TPA: YhcN/YlaJ family sporulation lipoprotein [Bacilli bacterium]|nr:YhcN/YlaJ family sporulation lipoprotein [Bacilli bacterium]
MDTSKWLKALTAALVLVPLAGCNPQAAGDNANTDRVGINSRPDGAENIGMVRQTRDVTEWDNKSYDVDGDGDRGMLSGRNNIGNPAVDLRSIPQPGSTGANINSGLYAGTATADRIADLAGSVEGVAHANVIVVGETAVIGLNLNRGVAQADMPGLVQLVRQRVLVQAPVFKRVHITTDRAMTRQIRRISDEIRAGHSLTMFNDDFMDLVRRIPAVAPGAMPAVPNR